MNEPKKPWKAYPSGERNIVGNRAVKLARIAAKLKAKKMGEK